MKLKFSAVLNLVEVTKCVTFQSAKCTGFKVASFRISPIEREKMRTKFKIYHHSIVCDNELSSSIFSQREREREREREIFVSTKFLTTEMSVIDHNYEMVT